MNFSDLVKAVTQPEIESYILSTAKANGAKVDSWKPKGALRILIYVFALALFQAAQLIARAIRGMFIDLATDPGDDGIGAPGPGWLSALGESMYNTPRIDATFANGKQKLTNTSGGSHFFSPLDLTFQNGITGKTYKNVDDPLLYPGGVCQLGPGETISIPIVAEEVGTISDAAPGEISILMSAMLGVTTTNDGAILGSDREPRDAYIARCKLAAAATSPNGPKKAYEYIALSARSDGTFGLSKTGTPLNITRVQVTKDSAVGRVDAWFAAEAGSADPGEFAIVDTMIDNYAVPDAVTYTGHLANEVAVAIDYSVEASASPGLTDQEIKDAISAALVAYFKTIPIGGFKPIAGSGKVFASLIRAVIGKSHKAIYSVTLNTPSGDVALTIGDVAKLGAITGSVTMS